MADGCHHGKSQNHHIFVTVGPIATKIGTVMQLDPLGLSDP